MGIAARCALCRPLGHAKIHRTFLPRIGPRRPRWFARNVGLCYGLNDWVLLRQRIQDGEAEAMQKQIELQKVDAVLSLCETASCRRQLLLAQFDEASEPCGHCDNCSEPPTRFDATVLVQKLLSCVYRVEQRFATSYVIDVLRGKSNDWIARLEHDKLSTSWHR